MKIKKKLIFIIVFSVFFMITASFEVNAESQTKSNDYPIILVHGLAGWGEGEMLGINYWGGNNDVVALLNNNGHKTYTATVGPVSSNWDRAVELYYYIKGGRVDYGAAHAKENGHDRYGRTFPGIYSEWDNKSKVHLVGHSMGGQTIRVLTELLAKGSAAEQEYYNAHPEEGISPLFEGDKEMIHSVTSIATPHNGSTFADEKEIVSFIKKLILDVAVLSGANRLDSIVYDFKLEQWGLKRNPGETFSSYLDRVMNSSVMESTDISVYDLKTEGAAELNSWVKAQPDVYYFSHTGNASYQSLSGYYYPMVTMNPLLWGASFHMGSYTDNDGPGPIIDREWWPNDGLVNVISSKYPFGRENEPIDDTISKGVWNYYPVQQTWDHLDFIGLSAAHLVSIRKINKFYLDIASQVHGLPE